MARVFAWLVLGVRGKRISGRDLVAMGHMKCGQPPDVRDCRPDDVAARLHTECAGWNEKVVTRVEINR